MTRNTDKATFWPRLPGSKSLKCFWLFPFHSDADLHTCVSRLTTCFYNTSPHPAPPALIGKYGLFPEILASQRTGNIYKGYEDLFLEATARIGP